MKKTFISVITLTTCLGYNVATASMNSSYEDEIYSSSSSNTVMSKIKGKIKSTLDVNKDGKVNWKDAKYLVKNFKQVMINTFDFNGDGRLSWRDVHALLDADQDGKLTLNDLNHRYLYWFDRNGDGQVEMNEIFSTVRDVFGGIDALANSFRTIINKIHSNQLFEILPFKLQGAFEKLFDLVLDGSEKVSMGMQVADDYTHNVKGALKDIQKRLNKSEISERALESLKPEIKALIARVDFWDVTGEETGASTKKILKALK